MADPPVGGLLDPRQIATIAEHTRHQIDCLMDPFRNKFDLPDSGRPGTREGSPLTPAAVQAYRRYSCSSVARVSGGG